MFRTPKPVFRNRWVGRHRKEVIANGGLLSTFNLSLPNSMPVLAASIHEGPSDPAHQASTGRRELELVTALMMAGPISRNRSRSESPKKIMIESRISQSRTFLRPLRIQEFFRFGREMACRLTIA